MIKSNLENAIKAENENDMAQEGGSGVNAEMVLPDLLACNINEIKPAYVAFLIILMQ
jgi:hypothetical protein